MTISMKKQNINKRQYTTPILTKVGSLKKITLKTGSNTDSSMPRVV
jgi:hypothetical protein